MTTTSRSLCPSNCNYESGKGYCAYTATSVNRPVCICASEWTGADCARQNFCLDNNCTNNSTCVNYPRLNAYLCQCPSGFSGRLCEIGAAGRDG